MVGLLLVYCANGDFLAGNDAKPNLYQAASLLTEGNLSFTPWEMPFLFEWQLRQGELLEDVSVPSWGARAAGRRADELWHDGLLTLKGPRYFLVPSERQDTYINTYGPGAGLCFLPVAALLRVTNGLPMSSKALWFGGKLTASLLVALSALLVFLTASAYTSEKNALWIALAYGLGTGAWSTASQSLWQHGPAMFFVALATWLFTRPQTRWIAVVAGFALSAATVCRPTCLVIAAIFAGFAVWKRRRAAGWLLLGAAPLAALLMFYNDYYLGSPLSSAQVPASKAMALRLTGQEGVWQTPLWYGLLSTLFSPSRGLLVFSPFLGFALAALVPLFRDRKFSDLRPVALAVVLLLAVVSMYSFWWAGWSFGPRYSLDFTPLMALLLIPTLSWLRRRNLQVVFILLVSWSIGVQFIGAFAYDVTGWNARIDGYSVAVPEGPPIVAQSQLEVRTLLRQHGNCPVTPVVLNVNEAEHRHRLWSLSDNQISYYLGRFRASRVRKKQDITQWLADPAG